MTITVIAPGNERFVVDAPDDGDRDAIAQALETAVRARRPGTRSIHATVVSDVSTTGTVAVNGDYWYWKAER